MIGFRAPLSERNSVEAVRRYFDVHETNLRRLCRALDRLDLVHLVEAVEHAAWASRPDPRVVRRLLLLLHRELSAVPEDTPMKTKAAHPVAWRRRHMSDLALLAGFFPPDRTEAS